jgi:hypothetical protein
LNEGADGRVIHPDGFFDGSPKATNYVHYRIAGTLDVLPVERYQKDYYRPGLLTAIMRGEKVEAKVPASKALPPK